VKKSEGVTTRNRCLLGLLIVPLLPLAITLFQVPVGAYQGIIRVPSEYPTIQEAINAAPPKSMILVSGGTYHEHLVVNKTVQLVGIDRMTTIIDGDRNGVGIAVTADNVFISGFTVQNCAHEPYEWGYGGIQLVECNNCTITDNVVTANVCNGILLKNSNNTVILANIITLNGGSSYGDIWGDGIDIVQCHNATLKGNIVVQSEAAGIALERSNDSLVYENVIENSTFWGIELSAANDNKIHHNSFFENPAPIDVQSSYNDTWSDGTEGNYWDDYVGLDNGNSGRVAGDGVGDTDLPVYGVDNYPLVQPPRPIPIVWENVAYPVILSCNSTVSSFHFAQADKRIVFSVRGPSNTTGYFNVTIPKALLHDDPWKVTLNNTGVTDKAIITENQTYTTIHLVYSHGDSYDVQVIGTWVIPEYPTASPFVLLILLAMPPTILIAKKRKNSKRRLAQYAQIMLHRLN